MSDIRLIDANALKKALKDAHINMKLTFDIATFNCVMNTVDNAPTVEPTFGLFKEMLCAECEKRPQGEWIIVKNEKWGDNVKCPFCGKELAGTDLNFCCKCGAKMKGGAE